VENQSILTGKSEFNLAEQIRSAILLLASKWENRDLEFELAMEELPIVANEEMLKQVWINLLDNAIKFTPEQGKITVTVEQKGEKIQITVSNTGSEIAPEHMDKIFRKFYQTDESHSAEGSGVGLAIVKRILDLHRGTVSVTSADMLTSFCVLLPAK
jgi:signal transduction histidine kinase